MRDWLEAAAAALGVVSLLGAFLLSATTVHLVAEFGDPVPGLPNGDRGIPALDIGAIGLSAAAAVATFLLGRALAGRRIVRGVADLVAGRSEPGRWTAGLMAVVLLAGCVAVTVAVFGPKGDVAGEGRPGTGPAAPAPGPGIPPPSAVRVGNDVCPQCR